MEVEEVALIDKLYRDFIYSGLAFGAKRWLASLQRACERTSSLMTTTMSHDIGGGIQLVISWSILIIIIHYWKRLPLVV
jgi:homeobox-leucine zipper protein